MEWGKITKKERNSVSGPEKLPLPLKLKKVDRHNGLDLDKKREGESVGGSKREGNAKGKQKKVAGGKNNDINEKKEMFEMTPRRPTHTFGVFDNKTKIEKSVGGRRRRISPLDDGSGARNEMLLDEMTG